MGYGDGEDGDRSLVKKVLIIHYSQTGQLTDILKSIAAPLEKNAEISVTFARIAPKTPFPFPWGFWRF